MLKAGRVIHQKAPKRRECLKKEKKSLSSFATQSVENMRKTAREFTTQMVIMKPLRVLRSLKASMGSQHTL